MEFASKRLGTTLYVGFGVLARQSHKAIHQNRFGHIYSLEDGIRKRTDVVPSWAEELDAAGFLASPDGNAFLERLLASGVLFHTVNFMKQMSKARSTVAYPLTDVLLRKRADISWKSNQDEEASEKSKQKRGFHNG